MYGQYLSKEQADALSAPPRHVLSHIKRWLRDHVVTSEEHHMVFEPAVNILSIVSTVEHIERVLETEIHHFSQVNSKRRRILRSSSSIRFPPKIAQHVTFSTLNQAPVDLKAMSRHTSSEWSSHHPIPNDPITPAYLRTFYGIPQNLSITNESNVQGLAEFFEENWSRRDLEAFNRNMEIEPVKGPRIIQAGDRVNDLNNPTSEASLDIQYLTAMAPNATTLVMTLGGRNPHSDIDEPFVTWAQQVLEMDSPPLVFSMSYSDDELHIFDSNEAYARSFDPLLMKMGLRGISVLFASGDDGVSGQKESIPSDQMNKEQACRRNGPQWPTSSPYVTAVGATMTLGANREMGSFFYTAQEVVCNAEWGGNIVSGGAFSDRYDRPQYQDKVVSNYVDVYTSDLPHDFFNKQGRGYPDVSGLGANYRVWKNGKPSPMSGTSASTPLWSAMITLWNDRRLNAGKPPLGFINPLLYAIHRLNASAFYDIVVGNNGGTQDADFSCEFGFEAAPGWDAATGLGSPNFPVLSDLTFEAESLFRLGVSTNDTLNRPPLVKHNTRMVELAPTMFHVLCIGWIIVAGFGMMSLWRRIRSKDSLLIRKHAPAIVEHAEIEVQDEEDLDEEDLEDDLEEWKM